MNVPEAAFSSIRRRVLLSAFACAPGWGSEPGVGWRWVTELARRHDVTVVTHERFRSLIEAELAVRPRSGLSFSYFAIPGAGGDLQRQVDSRAYYCRWQFAARRQVKRLQAQTPHDLLHHLTWGSYRLPIFMHGLGLPLVVGPVGGGEGAGAAARLCGGWPWREQLFYRLRAASIVLSRFDPLLRRTMHEAALVLVKTPATGAALPREVQDRVVAMLEIGVDPSPAPAPRLAPAERPLRLLYAGALSGGKGPVYAVDAAIELRRRGVPVQLTLAGGGRLAAWLRARVDTAGAGETIRFLGQRPHAEMPTLYDAHDLLVFPSWHDSSGNVVLEALARALPVLCLDIGGPRSIVDERCAAIVSVAGLDAAGLARALADRIAALAHDRPALLALAQGAGARIAELSWAAQVARAYGLIEARLGWAAAPAGGRA